MQDIEKQIDKFTEEYLFEFEPELRATAKAELLSLFTTSVEEIIGSEKLDMQGKIICDCDCQTAICNSLYHPCKKPDDHILQRDEAAYQIREQQRAEQRKRLAKLLKP